MKLVRRSGILTVATLGAIAVIASPLAMADDSGWYIGVGLGQAKTTIDDARITGGLLSTGLTATSITDDNRDVGYKLSAGYALNKNFALEGSYFDLGNFGYRATTTPTGTLNGTIKLRGLSLDAVGMVPIYEKLSLLGRLGMNYTEARDSFTGTGLVSVRDSNPHKFDLNYKLGVGLQYAFNETLAMRAELERYRINDAVGGKGHIDLASIGLIYRFGATAPAGVPRATAPATAR